MSEQDTLEDNPFLEVLPNLDRLREVIWDELETSASHPDQPWGLGILGTVCQHSQSETAIPELRTLVLRKTDRDSRTLIWHTDRRSPKVKQLQSHAESSVLFWSPVYRVQLVVRGTTEVFTTEQVVDTEWSSTQLTSRRAYLGTQAPGEEADTMCVNFPKEFTTRPPTIAESESGRDHFAVLKTDVKEMDVLLLRQSGNVRASYIWNPEEKLWKAVWVCP